MYAKQDRINVQLSPSALPSRWVRTLLCGAILSFLLSACGGLNKFDIAAGLPAPDIAFQTGDVAGYDVYIWQCYHGKRIAIYNSSAEFSSTPYRREEVSCGELTQIEKSLPEKGRRLRDPSVFWQQVQ